MRYIYFSPHLDDAVFSCGGIIAQQVAQGKSVEVWSFFTADPPRTDLTPFAKILHKRWGKSGNPYQVRRKEDMDACTLLSVNFRHFRFLDCIYRRYPGSHTPVVKKTADLFKPVCEKETELLTVITHTLRQHLDPDDVIILPLGVGSHIDHLLVKNLAGDLENERLYYPDYPYAAKIKSINDLTLPQDAVKYHYLLTGAELRLWQKSAGCYQSQVSSFWKSAEEMKADIARYAFSLVGSTIWSF